MRRSRLLRPVRYRCLRLRRRIRNAFIAGESPERIARGVAAGFFATAFPLPGLQIPLSILCAWVARGNKVIAIFPQFLSNAGTMLPLAVAQFWVGTKFWPGAVGKTSVALGALREAEHAWNWSEPAQSIHTLWSALAGLGSNVLGPLALGVLITGIAMAALAYPITLVASTVFYVNRIRMQQRRGLFPGSVRKPLLLPSAAHAARSGKHLSPADYVIHHSHYMTADYVKLLFDGRAAYPEMLACIAGARESIEMETYILRADRTGQRFASALINAARRGVRVRLLYDGFGCLGLPWSYVHALLSAGVRVAVFRPFSAFLKFGFGPMNRRDHRKALTVDGRITFTGGLNIGDEYAAPEDGGQGWRDTHLRIDGRIPAHELQKLFEQTWSAAEVFKAEHESGAANHKPVGGPAHPSAVQSATSTRVPIQILSNREFLKRVRIRRAYMHAIRNARRYILLENAFFIPDRGICRALYRAVRRGVVVAVVVASKSDVGFAAMASHALYSELLSHGVRLFEYPVSMLHCKVAVIDDEWSVVSTYNLDHRSLRHDLESAVLLLDCRVAQTLRDQIMADIARCDEISLELHRARPWNVALLESLCYQMRYWL